MGEECSDHFWLSTHVNFFFPHILWIGNSLFLFYKFETNARILDLKRYYSTWLWHVQQSLPIRKLMLLILVEEDIAISWSTLLFFPIFMCYFL